MWLFILLLIAGIGFSLYRRYRKAKKRHEVLLNEPPKKAWIAVSLPYGVADAEKRTPGMFRSIISLLTDDAEARESGKGQLDAMAYFEVKKGEIAPTLTYLIGCDPEKMPMVKRAIKHNFQNPSAATISDRREGDPLLDVVEWFRQQELAAARAEGELDEEPDAQTEQSAV